MRLLFCAPMLLVAALLCSAQTERALLIGIKTYQPEGTTAEHPAGCAYGRCELGRFDNLKCESGGLAHIASVADPAEQPWTNMLSWDGTNWTLRHAAAPSAAAGGSVVSGTKEWRAVAPVKLGAKLTAAALQQHLPAGAKVWVNLLPSSAMAAKLALHDSNSAVRAAPELANANYILVGALPD